MEPLPAQGTWKYESFREYAEHSVEHDDIPDRVRARNCKRSRPGSLADSGRRFCSWLGHRAACRIR